MIRSPAFQTQFVSQGRLLVHPALWQFINDEALSAVDMNSTVFWERFEKLLLELQPENRALLDKREWFQQQIDAWHQQHPHFEFSKYKQFLREIGYWVPPPPDFEIATVNVDPEIAMLAGPQLVVPINNARYALNAANARWGSLYDALYGTDVLPGKANTELPYDPERGQQVINWAKAWLDATFPLSRGHHAHAKQYKVETNQLVVVLKDGSEVCLQKREAFSGFQGSACIPSAILLNNHGLHVEIQIDKHHPVGASDSANVKDILMEAALTTIMDCEDSVAAVDGEDKTLVYQNWAGLIRGDLSTELQKNGKTYVRTLNSDRIYQAADGSPLTLSGRSLMFIRNVGHLMTCNAMLINGEKVFEGLMDAVITCLIAKQDILKKGKFQNSNRGSIYIVKPKMHGPEEVAFSDKLFKRVEQLLELPEYTIKMGIMDEERRTSANLKSCIAAARERVVFINTGFLDRTGDEIHTSMQRGAFATKSELKNMLWINAYEKSNVALGLACGFSGTAQIGKGMWPEPDNMSDMMAAKIEQVKSGANTAWVPSPTAATLHALHYHTVSVKSIQENLTNMAFNCLDDILTIPVKPEVTDLPEDAKLQELENNVQGILGYVVHWVHHGIGCSKVLDINNVGLMEDRATLRISSQHIANWLEHNVVSEAQVNDSLRKMSKLVDAQNAEDPAYIAMGPEPDESIAYQAAKQLIFEGKRQPSGYTEPVLHQKRIEMKARLKK